MPAIGQLQDIWDARKTLTISDTWYKLPIGKNWLQSVCKSDLKVTFAKLSSVNQKHKCCFWQNLQRVLYPNVFNPLSSSWLPHTLNERWWELAMCNSLNVENELELFIIQLWKLWNNFKVFNWYPTAYTALTKTLLTIPSYIQFYYSLKLYLKKNLSPQIKLAADYSNW